jgi:uncharacterized membrane protein
MQDGTTPASAATSSGRKPSPAGRIQSTSIVLGLILSAAACAILYARIWEHNPHASFYYLLLMYGLLLPLSILFLRGDIRDRTPPADRLPPVHLAVLAAVAVTILLVQPSLINARCLSDESAYRFQARIFTAGQIAAEPMPGNSANAAERPDYIYFEHTIQAPWGWFCKYPPGWPLVLAAGYLLHIPWLMNPILALIQLVCVWYLARPFGAICQTVAISFTASSAYFLMWSMGFMSHAAGATLALLALMTVLQSAREKSVRWFALSCVMVFAAAQVRQYTGAVIGGVCALIALAAFWNQRRLRLQAFAVIAIAAAISAAAFLAENRIYTGDMFVSPYAMVRGGHDVPELTLTPRGILANLANTTRWELADTIRVTFPFLFLLAAYAVFREKRYRLEVAGLSLLFPALVLAHIIKADPSGSYNGNRLYYEGFAAIAIAAARGCQLLIEDWRISGPRLAGFLAVMLALQAVQCVIAIQLLRSITQPYIAMYDYAHRELNAPLVFVHDSAPQFTAKHTNWNDVHWRSAPTVYLIDPGPGRRDEAACRFGRPAWSVIAYDPSSKYISSSPGTSVCPATR